MAECIFFEGWETRQYNTLLSQIIRRKISVIQQNKLREC